MEMTKRLFILGASVLQLPAILEAKKMGFEVGVADMNSEAIGAPYADVFFPVSTTDINGIISSVESFGADGIMTLATDMPMRTIAQVCKRFPWLVGLDCETAIRCTDKSEMIKAFHAYKVPAPWYKIVNREGLNRLIPNSFSYPCISKPIDASGSRGVCYIESPKALIPAVRYSLTQSRDGKAIIEEYLDGDEISVEAITVKGETHIIAITDKVVTGQPYFVEMGHSQPSKYSLTHEDEICQIATKAIHAVGIVNGPSHIEMKNTSKGFKMIEIGARLGGDCITTHLVPLSTGISMVRATIDLALGYTPDLNIKTHKGSAIRYIPHNQEGILQDIRGVEQALKMPFIENVVINKLPGEPIGEIKSSNDRLGFVISCADNASIAINACEDALASISYTIQTQK